MLKTAVIGCGAMGRNHLRVLAELEHVQLVAAADQDARRLEGLQRRFGVETFPDYRRLLEQIGPDCVVVAVPTLLHAQVVTDTLDAGIHTLVEKPIAATVGEAQALAELAERSRVLLAVGHVEHFNPAVTELKRRLDAGELGRIFEARVQRLGPFPARVRDVGVVLDLATHDLDVLRYLIGGEVSRVYAETERRIHTAHEDLLVGLLRFSNGVVASLDINWLTPAKVRTLQLTGQRGMFVVDYLLQELSFHANDAADSLHWEALQTLRGVSEGSMTRFKLEKREPLRVELEQFTAAVLRAKGFPGTWAEEPPTIVTARDGVEVLKLATAIVQSGQAGTALDPRAGGAGVMGLETAR